MPFAYEPMFQTGQDDTAYRLLGREGVSVIEVNGRSMLRVDRSALKQLARQAFIDVSFYLRPKHLAKLREELADPEASDNDRFVIYTHLQNAVVAAVRAHGAQLERATVPGLLTASAADEDLDGSRPARHGHGHGARGPGRQRDSGAHAVPLRAAWPGHAAAGLGRAEAQHLPGAPARAQPFAGCAEPVRAGQGAAACDIDAAAARPAHRPCPIMSANEITRDPPTR